MPVIGVKELKSHASLILRSLRERKSKGYVITVRGTPVARLTPIEEEELEDLILSMDNPKFKTFLDEIKKEPSVSWEQLLSEGGSGKTSTGSKKAS